MKVHIRGMAGWARGQGGVVGWWGGCGLGCVGARAGRGVPGASQAVPGDGFLKGIWYQNGSPRKGAQSAKVLIFIASQRLYPFLAGGKRKFFGGGFWGHLGAI